MTLNLGTYGKITASRDAFNKLSLLLAEASNRYEERGLDALADEASEMAVTLYDELDKVGYYDKYR